jgi:hypothetical protein
MVTILVDVTDPYIVNELYNQKEDIMSKELKILQLFYASALADSVYHYNKSGILNLITEEKRNTQALTAESQLKQLGVSTPKELFEFFSKVFACIQWDYKENNDEIIASGSHCLLCGLAKKMQTAQPCYIYCINPFREMLNAMTPSYKLSVDETLWKGNKCIFTLTKNNAERNK